MSASGPSNEAITVGRIPWAVVGLAWMVAVMACDSASRGAVGSSCTDAAECSEANATACILAWTDGYCSEIDCSVGSCPEGSRCVRGIRFANVPFDAFCLAVCTPANRCRSGYRCADLSMPETVCVPES